MTDTKKPANPETATAPLGRPYAETVSLEVVWAAAYAAYAANVSVHWQDDTVNLDSLTTADARECSMAADYAVDALLAAHPRGAT